VSKFESRYYTQISGEFFVAGELFRQGFFANVSFGNAKSFDIIVFSKNENKFAKIEVKSSSDPYFTRKSKPVYKDDHKFHFNIESLEKEMKTEIKNKFYVFVVLNTKNRKPDFFIFPSREIWNIMKTKINKCKKDNKKVSGRWDIKLSEIYKNKENEKKDNWECLIKYFE